MAKTLVAEVSGPAGESCQWLHSGEAGSEAGQADGGSRLSNRGTAGIGVG